MDSKLSVIILAAGKGTRFVSERPKVMFTLLGRPLVDYSLDLAETAGAAATVAITGYGAEQVEAVCTARSGVTCARQEEQLGTGHAVLQAKPALGEFAGDVLIVAGDCPLLDAAEITEMLATHRDSGAAVTVAAMELDNPHGYGRMIVEGDELTAIVEQRDLAPDQEQVKLVNSGAYLVRSPLLWDLLDALGNDNAQGEYYLTDIIAGARERGERVGYTVAKDAVSFSGVNTRLQLAQLEDIARERLLARLAESGVTLHGPGTIEIEASVKVEPDAEIGRGCVLGGATEIGAGASLGVGCVIHDSVIGPGARLKPYTICEQAVVERDAIVGPWARLRPGAVVKAGAHVGNFVELKKTVLGEGAKANHLTYLGDTEVGPGANIGAGTITCNYDGYNKHKTEIGAGAFIGSNTSLVAPVKVGDRAITGAGSVITKEVADDALAIERGDQRGVPGYAARQRKKHGK